MSAVEPDGRPPLDVWPDVPAAHKDFWLPSPPPVGKRFKCRPMDSTFMRVNRNPCGSDLRSRQRPIAYSTGISECTIRRFREKNSLSRDCECDCDLKATINAKSEFSRDQACDTERAYILCYFCASNSEPALGCSINQPQHVHWHEATKPTWIGAAVVQAKGTIPWEQKVTRLQARPFDESSPPRQIPPTFVLKLAISWI